MHRAVEGAKSRSDRINRSIRARAEFYERFVQGLTTPEEFGELELRRAKLPSSPEHTADFFRSQARRILTGTEEPNALPEGLSEPQLQGYLSSPTPAPEISTAEAIRRGIAAGRDVEIDDETVRLQAIANLTRGERPKPQPTGAPATKPAAAMPELRFHGLAGSIIDGKRRQFADIWNPEGNDVARVEVTQERGGRPEVRIELAAPHAAAPYAAALERHIRRLVDRAIAGLPTDIADARRLAETWRTKYEAARNRGNRVNAPVAERRSALFEAEQARVEMLKWRKAVEELTPEQPPAAAGGAAPPAERPAFDYASTQVNLPESIAGRIREYAARIPDTDLAEKGREEQPHITVLYGLEGEDPQPVRELLAGERPIRVTLGKASIFPDTGSGEILKLDVDSDDLRRLNARLGALPHTETHPGGYKPHATIAYLKPGEGAKYAGKPVPGVSGREVTVSAVTFSDRNRNQVDIKLAAGEGESAAPETPAAPAAQVPPSPEGPTGGQLGLLGVSGPGESPQAEPPTSVAVPVGRRQAEEAKEPSHDRETQGRLPGGEPQGPAAVGHPGFR